MSLHGELRAVLFGEETEVVIDFLKERGLLASEKTCQRCDTEMRFSVKASLNDKFVWRCKRKGCKTNVSVRDGSFFTKSKLSLNKLLHCIYLWSLETPIVSASTQLGVSEQTLVDQYNFLREVCSAALLRRDSKRNSWIKWSRFIL